MTTTRRIRWIGYGVDNIAWFIIFAHDWGIGFADHLNKTAGIILVAAGLAGSTVSLSGGFRESRVKVSQSTAVNAPQSE